MGYSGNKFDIKNKDDKSGVQQRRRFYFGIRILLR
jgi:hypothetical protein